MFTAHTHTTGAQVLLNPSKICNSPYSVSAAFFCFCLGIYWTSSLNCLSFTWQYSCILWLLCQRPFDTFTAKQDIIILASAPFTVSDCRPYSSFLHFLPQSQSDVSSWEEAQRVWLCPGSVHIMKKLLCWGWRKNWSLAAERLFLALSSGCVLGPLLVRRGSVFQVIPQKYFFIAVNSLLTASWGFCLLGFNIWGGCKHSLPLLQICNKFTCIWGELQMSAHPECM